MKIRKEIFCVAVSTLLIFNGMVIFAGSGILHPTQEAEIKVEKAGKTLHLTGLVPAGVTEIEIRYFSNRNNNISDIKEVSPNNPRYDIESRSPGQYAGNLYYPVVDIALERGMEGMLGFEGDLNDSCIVNGPLYKQKQVVKPWLSIPSNVLQTWENSVYVHLDSCILKSFYIRKNYALITRQVDIKVNLLSEKWEGKVLVLDKKTNTELLSTDILAEMLTIIKYADGNSLEKDRLLKALDGCIGFTKRSQMKDVDHPSDGGLFLFYDLDAQVYRSYHWVWGWGPSVTMLTMAAEYLPEQRKDLLQFATEIGEASLRFLWKRPDSPLNDIMISRWQRRVEYEDGYLGAITIADALFMAGWAWMPIYEATGDKRFLDATDHHCRVTNELLKEWTIIPHSYYIDDEHWSDFVIDETGFGMEGFDDIYRLTGDKFYQETGRKFIEGHIKTFGRPDGQWNRQFRYADSRVTSNTRMVRGMGWAMEGLLVANRLMPGAHYLDAAKKMADHLVKSQHSNGSWSFNYDRPVAETGIGEKGTALWSYLFYELYKASNDKTYLDVARKALIWCMNEQYDGPDPEAYGSIVGRNPQSGVGYRSWFNVSCTYTSAFMGMAILEELLLQQ
jgi:hypothetical protein